MTLAQLSRLKALRPAPRKPRTPAAEFAEPRGDSTDLPAGASRLAELLDARTNSNSFGDHLGLRRWFSEPISTDATPDREFDVAALRLLLPDAPAAVTDPAQWLFLDTETTGLAGGTGTYPFMVGIAWWDAGGLEIEQFFMREQSEEHSLLAALSERIAERPVLVTFNGKSFDWPLLETRYRMTRVIRTPALRAHLDFLHPARNLWRLRLGSVRLAELEKHVLGFHRGADLVSELIPQMYFDYLRGGPPDPLVPIFNHNQMDLRGLAALAVRVLSLLTNPVEFGRDPLELFGVSRICERRGEGILARRLYERTIARELPPETGRLARRSLARLAKRDGDHDVARQMWEEMLGYSHEGLEAYEQLAIYYEHRARDPRRAATLVREALHELGRANRHGVLASNAYRGWRARFHVRLARLERKAAKTLLDTLEVESQPPAAESN